MKKESILALMMFTFVSIAFGQEVKYQLSTHILDITQGAPAPNVEIKLQKLNKNKEWETVDEKTTDDNGRINDFLKEDGKSKAGIYKLTYFIEPYFKSRNQSTFYPFIEVVFDITDDKHYHVPITLSPYGYSTYRGS